MMVNCGPEEEQDDVSGVKTTREARRLALDRKTAAVALTSGSWGEGGRRPRHVSRCSSQRQRCSGSLPCGAERADCLNGGEARRTEREKDGARERESDSARRRRKGRGRPDGRVGGKAEQAEAEAEAEVQTARAADKGGNSAGSTAAPAAAASGGLARTGGSENGR
ncbi:circumsporozoite protein-like [Schistocerca serialis cubense]|uniref:circumsporozoite protein-like n=1 Tax=Schistocerca serialis cubense TaxID=2023355 RepID=UPI00214E5404|nr:circumsporozoite protein-like [Schistocerca serialis cubense]